MPEEININTKKTYIVMQIFLLLPYLYTQSRLHFHPQFLLGTFRGIFQSFLLTLAPESRRLNHRCIPYPT